MASSCLSSFSGEGVVWSRDIGDPYRGLGEWGGGEACLPGVGGGEL